MKQLKQVFLIIQLFISVAFAAAQDRELLQIKQLKDDTAKVNKLIAYGKTWLDVDNAKAVAIYRECIAISQRLKYDAGTAMSYRRIGYVHGQEGRYQEAINHFHAAIFFYRKSNSLQDLLICYNNLGANLRQLGMVDSTIHYYYTAIQLFDKHPVEKEAAPVKEDLLSTYAMLHENISTLYGNLENVSKAIQFGNKAIDISRQIGDSVRLALAMISTSNAYYVDKNFGESLALARQASAIANAIQHPIAQAKAYHLLSVSYTGLHKLDSAIDAAGKALVLAKNTDRQLYLTALMDLADAYHDKKDFGKEVVLLKEATQVFKGLDNVPFGLNLYEKLAQANYALGNYKEAFDNLAISGGYQDSVMRLENKEVVARTEAEYETAKKERALALGQLQLVEKDLQLQTKRNQVFYALMALVIAVLVVVLLFLRSRHNKRLHQKEVEAIQQEKELQLLHALMQGEEKERNRIARDLHDGVAGMLAAVKMHLSSFSPEERSMQPESFRRGIALLDEATAEIRKTSHNLMPELLLAHGLDIALQRYCANISNTNLSIQYDSWGEIKRYKSSFELSVYRIVQELLNNIMKHARATQALVQLSVQGNTLSITVEDNGVGFSPQQKTGGMGFEQLQTRIRAMNGNFEVESSPGSGVSAYLEFNVQHMEEKAVRQAEAVA
ncbi:sensor histidine kinase [Flavisolibacter sp. BT320]|nr:sensor histidine kinase [Flavisolibacter longurius]